MDWSQTTMLPFFWDSSSWKEEPLCWRKIYSLCPGNSNTFIDANRDLTEDHVLVSRVWLNRESSNFKDGHGWYDLHSFIPIWASIVQWNFLPYWKSAWTTISCQVCLWYQGSHVIPLLPLWRALQVNLKQGYPLPLKHYCFVSITVYFWKVPLQGCQSILLATLPYGIGWTRGIGWTSKMLVNCTSICIGR